MEMIDNLKEMRDRVRNGDIKAVDEFFNLYVFSDDNKVKTAEVKDER